MPKRCHNSTVDFMMPTVTSVSKSATYIYKITDISLMVLLKDISSLKFPIDNYIFNIPTVTTVSTPSNPPYINVFFSKSF